MILFIRRVYEFDVQRVALYINELRRFVREHSVTFHEDYSEHPTAMSRQFRLQISQTDCQLLVARAKREGYDLYVLLPAILHQAAEAEKLHKAI